MNQKHYIGNRVTSMELYDEIGPVTGVALIVDDENEIFAGDESGYVLEMPCPYATYAMANSMLAKAKGRTYKGYSAENAPLGIGAELGDGVTVGRVYSMLAYQKLSFGSGHLSAIAAPGEKETDHEFPYQSPLKREVRRNKAQAYSRISKTAEAIRNEVFGEDGYTGTSLAVQLGEIAGKVEGKINGTDAEALIKAALEKIQLSISNDEGTTSFILSGDGTELTSEKFDLHVKAVNIHGKLSAEQIETDQLKVEAANITGSLTIGQLPSDVATTGDIPDVSNFATTDEIPKNLSDLNSDVLFEHGITRIIDGHITTDYINALAITAASVSASNITSGTLNASGITLDGFMAVKNGSAVGYIGANNSKGGVVISASNESVYCIATNAAAKMSYYEEKMIWVASGGCYSNETMQVFSDRTLKNSISYDLGTEEKMFALLRPCSFIYNSDSSKKKHWGFIAQDFIHSAETVGMKASELAVVGEYEGKYSLGYGEITALNTLMIQKLMKRMDIIEDKMEG